MINKIKIMKFFGNITTGKLNWLIYNKLELF